MDVISYWMGNFLFDISCMVFPACLCLLYVALWGYELFLGEAAIVTFLTVMLSKICFFCGNCEWIYIYDMVM